MATDPDPTAEQQSEQLFRLALEEAPIGVAVVGLDGRFLRVNHALCEIVGYPCAELKQLTFQAITHPDDVDTDVALSQQLARGEIPRYQLAKRYVRKDGAPVDVMLSAAIARGRDGTPLYYIAHVEDITDTKLAQDRLRQAQERYELALRGADLGAWDWNVVTGEVIFTARWAEMRGYRLEELRPHLDTWLTGVHPDDLPQVQHVLAEYLAGRLSDYECEHRVRTRSGAWIWVLDRGKVFARDAAGRPTRMVGTELDITVRKHLEQSLRESNAALDRAQSIATTGSWQLDVRNNALTWSDEAYRIFRVQPGTPMTYEAFLARVYPEDREHVQRMWTAALRGIPYDIEHRILANGTVRWVREKAELAFDGDGAPVRAIGIAQDITERKHADEALRLAEARSSSILAASADAIISIDEDCRITQFNAAAEKMFGYAKSEVLGATFDRLIPERSRARHREFIDAFAAGAETSRRMGTGGSEILGLRKTGEQFPAEAAISKIEVGGARVYSISMRDLSDEARIAKEQTFLAEASAALAASLDYEATLRRVAELAAKSFADVCIVDVVEESGEVRRLQVAFRDEQRARMCQPLTEHPIDRDRPHLAFASLRTKQPILIPHATEEVLASFAQSEEHLALIHACDPTSLMAVPMLVYDKLVGVLGLVTSRGSRTFATADLRLAEELARRAALSIENARLYRTARRAVQARDDVLGIVAHDLRNPLNVVRLHAQLLRMHDAAAERAADAIDRSAQRMDRLIEDLLDVSRLEAGRLQVEPTRVSAADLVNDATEAQRPLAERAGLTLALDIPDGLPDIWADRGRIMQVLDNLVGNALKFTARGGRIEVSAALHDNAVELAVRDTGAGLSSDAAGHVFDRFWQVRRADRRGAGLGLAIARGIVEAHGGRIWVESEVGRGTTFRFTVPVATSLAQPAVR